MKLVSVVSDRVGLRRSCSGQKRVKLSEVRRKEKKREERGGFDQIMGEPGPPRSKVVVRRGKEEESYEVRRLVMGW